MKNQCHLQPPEFPAFRNVLFLRNSLHGPLNQLFEVYSAPDEARLCSRLVPTLAMFALLDGGFTIPEDPWDWYISLHGWLIYMVNVGKYTIHGSYGNERSKKSTLPKTLKVTVGT